MTSGDATPAQMGAFLMGLKVRGETAEELAGGSRALRAKVLRVKAPEGTIDIVGTGGDHHGTYNVSSCSAFVVAGAGIPVAKHGNRAFTSKSGAADVLSALGIGLEVPIEALEKALVEARVCFLMAPRHHSAMRNVAGPRVELAPSRTIFNLLGPMSNPALVTRQLRAQRIAGLQQHVDHRRGGRELAPAQAVEQRLHLIGQLGHVGEAEGRRASLDGVGAAEDGVQLFVIGGLDVHIEQQLLHVVEVLAGFFKEDLVELAEIDAGTDAGAFGGHVTH
eukprot:gene54470-72787_t